MLRPSSNDGTLRLYNDDDEKTTLYINVVNSQFVYRNSLYQQDIMMMKTTDTELNRDINISID